MPALYPGQYFLTSEQFSDITSLHHLVLATPPRPMCLHDYWIAYIRAGSVLAVNCIKAGSRRPSAARGVVAGPSNICKLVLTTS